MNRHMASVVKQVVSEYVNRIESQGKSERLVVILDYETVEPDAVLKAVQSLPSKYEVLIFASETWYPQEIDQLNPRSVYKLPESRNVLIEKLRYADALVVPSISYSYIAKLSFTMDDDLPLYASIVMQLQGKPVIICKDNLALEFWDAPYGVTRRINSYLRQLQKENVSAVALSELSATIRKLINRPVAKRLISAEQVRSMAAKGQRELVVSSRAILTPLAKDIARQYGMVIIVKDEKGRG